MSTLHQRTFKLAVSIACSISFLSLANPTRGVGLINNSSFGYYNQSLGDLYSGDPAKALALYFPGPDISTGDPTASFDTAPDLSNVTRLGNWFSNPVSAVNNGFWSQLQLIPSTWAINEETAIIYEVDGGDYGISNLNGNFSVDNGIFVWVNGKYSFGATAPGGALADEYSNIALGSLSPGKNYIQILRADHGVGTGYNISVIGDYNPQPVPEQGSFVTSLGLGICGAFLVLKRKQKPTIKVNSNA